MARRPTRDVIVLLPGITGSVLRKDGRDVWAMTAGAVGDALFSLGRNIRELELDNDDADDGVTAPLVVPDLHLIPGLWKVDGYSKVSRYIQDHFEVTPGRNLHPFPYDWRRDNRIAAQRLKEQSDRWLHDWRKVHPEAKLILIGHSMGGLVSRYFLECLKGWRERACSSPSGRIPWVAQPFNFLVHGMKETLGPINLIDLSRLLRSFTWCINSYRFTPDRGDGQMIRASVGRATIPKMSILAKGEGRRNGSIGRSNGAVDSSSGRARNTCCNRYGDPSHCRHVPADTLLSARVSDRRVEFLEQVPRRGVGRGRHRTSRPRPLPIEFSHEQGADVRGRSAWLAAVEVQRSCSCSWAGS